MTTRSSSEPRQLRPGLIAFERQIGYSGKQDALVPSVPAIAWVAAHVALGLLLYQSPALATGHAFLVLGAGVGIAFIGTSDLIIAAAAYIVGAEVLWRMTHAIIPWEAAKYCVAVMFALGLFRMGRSIRWRALPMIYIALLLPAILVALREPEIGAKEFRSSLSMALSGPIALAVSAFFLSQRVLSSRQLQRVALALVGPAVGIAAITLLSTYTADDIRFTGESNFTTSGGFGPNQVSTILGLGAALSFVIWSQIRTAMALRILAVGLTGLCLIQGAMTFSRGGIFAGIGAIAIQATYLLRDRRAWGRILLWAPLVTFGTIVVVLPRIDTFTEGRLGDRFTEASTTNRAELIREDVMIWQDHPLLGVGPGRSKLFHENVGTLGHTEYSRLLAEHGVFGAAALMALITMVVVGTAQAERGRPRALTASFFLWVLFSMVHAAMRTAAPSFMFGLALARMDVDDDDVTPRS